VDRRIDEMSAMFAHIGHWTTGAWIVLGASLALLAVGIAIAFVARRRLAAVATALTAIGLLGSIGVAAMAGPGFMHGMMGGGMGSMMQSGETGRSGPAPVAGAREVRVESKEFSFAPAEIRLRAGETANVRFDNRGHMFHTFTVGELGLDLRANGGDQIVGSIRGERAGEYAFICTVSGHAQAGMQGKIVVES
jgi:plastocyanin